MLISELIHKLVLKEEVLGDVGIGLVLERLCSSCNRSFTLKEVQHNGCMNATITNFEDCPHCGCRNDIWIKVDWFEPTNKL